MEPHSRSCSSQNGTLRLPQALILLLRNVLASSPSDQVTQAESQRLWPSIRKATHRFFVLLNPLQVSGDRKTSLFVGMVKATALCGIGSLLWFWYKWNKDDRTTDIQGDAESASGDASTTDPGLMRKHSTVQSYHVSSTEITYPGIRTFYRPHPQESKLPRDPCPVPLLVFIHGLGGSIAQYSPILLSLSNLASCLAIDLPGCGLSSFAPRTWEAYTTDALVKLLAVVIEAHRSTTDNQTVVLVGHSMGCSLAALLASPISPHAHLLSQHVSGFVAICPQADPPSMHQVKALISIASVPTFAFDLFRKWDRRGGLNSKSVLRMAGAHAEEETRRLQLRFNKQSRTGVWQRMARGMCPNYSSGQPVGGLPDREVWARIHIPLFLIAGDDDHVTPASNVTRILEFLNRDTSSIQPPSEKASLPIAAAPIDPGVLVAREPPRKHQDSGIDAADFPTLEDDNATVQSTVVSADDSSVENIEGTTTDGSTTLGDGPLVANSSEISSDKPAPHPRRLVVKMTILPKPAAHALLFAPSTSRIIAGLIGNFFADHIDPRLSLAWQLQYLSTEGKWDVKNLEKWQAVRPVSEPIADVFHAMKTLREVDESHTPKVVAKQWHGKMCAIIDISHDNPVYDPKGLEDGGIPYHKFPTVSKQPPQADEVKVFIDLVDRIRAEGRDGLIGVHCHYGFNRTGFFLVSYLIERLGYRVEDAIDTFQKARPPGIRHSHFIDALHVRYCQGLKRAPTL